jgi:FkbM family methyltransferase
VAGRSTPSVGRVLRLAAAAGLVARHPRRACRTLYQETRGPKPEPPESHAQRFNRAMVLLTGLDVALSFERDGVKWTVPPGEDGIGEELFRAGTYCGETLDAVLAFVAERRPGCPWIVDVGANIGTTTIPCALAGFDVLAIEPVPATLRYLKVNIDSNALEKHVRVLEAAVAVGVDEVSIAVSTSLGNSEVIPTPASTPGFEGSYGRAETIRVPALELDAAVRSSNIPAESVAVVWSDAQGSDTSVIETGSALWSAGVPLFVEFWPPGLATKGGVDAFVNRASEHFKEFIHADNGGHEVLKALDACGDRRLAPRPVAELRGLEVIAANYPGQFTDVLLLP